MSKPDLAILQKGFHGKFRALVPRNSLSYLNTPVSCLFFGGTRGCQLKYRPMLSLTSFVGSSFSHRHISQPHKFCVNYLLFKLQSHPLLLYMSNIRAIAGAMAASSTFSSRLFILLDHPSTTTCLLCSILVQGEYICVCISIAEFCNSILASELFWHYETEIQR